jgi:hypothetical protein
MLALLHTSVCDAASRSNTLYKIDRRTQDPYTDKIRAYYLIRHNVLGYDHPELRPSASSALAACTGKMRDGNKWLEFFLVAKVSMKLKFSLGLLERNVDGWRDPDEDFEHPPYPSR